MATIAAGAQTDPARERVFFLGMAVWIAIGVAGGFGLAFGMGRSSFASPWWVHVHAISYTGWIGIYLLQNALVATGAVERHRALGWLAFVWATWLIPVGIGVTCLSLAAHRVPPFFSPSLFLALDPITVFTFYAFTVAAIRLRQRPDWHRRLMLAGTIFLIAPAWGRMLPMPLLGGELGLWAILAAQLLLYFGVAAGYDLMTRRQIHPAYFWGMGGSIAAVALIKPVSMLPFVETLAGRLAG